MADNEKRDIKIESFKRLIAEKPTFKELDYSIKVDFETRTEFFLAGLKIEETENLLMKKIKKGVFRIAISHMPAISKSGWELMSQLNKEERDKVLNICNNQADH